jgi:hypothetical protein
MHGAGIEWKFSDQAEWTHMIGPADTSGMPDFDGKDPLHEYDVELSPTEEDRLSRLKELKQAISEGRYDVDSELTRLMENMRQIMPGASPGDED